MLVEPARERQRTAVSKPPGSRETHSDPESSDTYGVVSTRTAPSSQSGSTSFKEAMNKPHEFDPGSVYHGHVNPKKPPSAVMSFIFTAILIILTFLIMTHSPTGKTETISDGKTSQLVCHSLTNLTGDTAIEKLDSENRTRPVSELPSGDLRRSVGEVPYCNSARQGLLSWMMLLGPATIASCVYTAWRGRQVRKHW